MFNACYRIFSLFYFFEFILDIVDNYQRGSVEVRLVIIMYTVVCKVGSAGVTRQ